MVVGGWLLEDGCWRMVVCFYFGVVVLIKDGIFYM
jgi:hypothetical protein